MNQRRRRRVELTDEALRTMLLARARRTEVTGLLGAVRRAAAQTPQRHRLVLLPRPARLWPRLAFAAATVAVVVLVAGSALLLGAGHPAGPPASASPSAIVSPPSPSPAAVAPVRPLTVAQLGRLLAGDRAAVTGRELVVSGRLEMVPAPCPPGGPSTRLLLFCPRSSWSGSRRR